MFSESPLFVKSSCSKRSSSSHLARSGTKLSDPTSNSHPLPIPHPCSHHHTYPYSHPYPYPHPCTYPYPYFYHTHTNTRWLTDCFARSDGPKAFRVVRSSQGNLPIYMDYRNGRTKVVTILRKCDIP